MEERIEAAEWLRIERIGMRALGRQSLSSPEWLGLKIALTGIVNSSARFVMVDEVQDYCTAQLMVLARYFSNAHFLLLGDPNQAITEGTASWAQVREVFEASRGSVAECELMTSYRSSPEITALFTRLMDRDERLKTNSVQRPGTQPVVRAFEDKAAWEDALRSAVRQAAAGGELAAVIAADKRSMKALEKLLADEPVTCMANAAKLPSRGVVLVDVALAKGLEFDEVIIPDASAGIYKEAPVWRHRLYTALSRATKRLTVLAAGQLTELLR